jgi:hypothetical protein
VGMASALSNAGIDTWAFATKKGIITEMSIIMFIIFFLIIKFD